LPARHGASGAREPRAEEGLVRTMVRLLGVLALAVTLAGCDKCGNWGFLGGSAIEACRPTVPQQ